MSTYAQIANERLRLATALTSLSDDEWEQPSLCGSWTNHEVAAHLNVPFEVGKLAFVAGFAKALGNFDRANERFAKDLAEQMSPEVCIGNLRRDANHTFTPPGFGPEAPLTDCIVHGVDILWPLGRPTDVAPESLAIVVPFLLTTKAVRAFGGISTADLRFEPDDVDLVAGSGDQVVTGPGLAMAAALAGRMPCLDALSGPGVDLLRSRLTG